MADSAAWRGSTDAFHHWEQSRRDIHAILLLGTEWFREALDKRFQEIAAEPSDGSTEVVDVFDDETFGASWTYGDWIRSSVLKDAVTAFEVYLEKAREEVLNSIGLTAEHKTDKRTPRFYELESFFAIFGLEIDSSGVKDVRNRRHILTHRRGELRRAEEALLSHSNERETHAEALILTNEGVLDDLSVLDDVVRNVDRRVARAMLPGPEDDPDDHGTDWLMHQIAIWALERADFRTID